jgi:nitrogenase-associated protein
MPAVSFWWKPGCATNTRQIRLLEAAGCEVAVRDLLTEGWTPDRLAGFLAGRPVSQWFNPAAPAVKDGSVNPSAFSAEGALARLVAEPILIRRPLIELDGARMSGFDPGWLHAHGIDLPAGPVPEGCSHGDAPAAYCPPPASAA